MYKQVQYAYSRTLGLLSCEPYFSSLKRKPTHGCVLQLITGCLWLTLSGCHTKCQHLIFHVATDPFVHIWNVMRACAMWIPVSSISSCTPIGYSSCAFPFDVVHLSFTVNNKEYMNYFTVHVSHNNVILQHWSTKGNSSH